ncbi:MAG: cupin domain-containing protein [Actinobacteria bacterium]|nr:cupin domain-containing protein [Actinomycetota bacterium]
MNALTASQVCAQLNLQPLEGEGGMWAPINRNENGNSIYFLMEKPDFSAWHVLEEAETWLHVAGAPIALHTIDSNLEIHTLSRERENINLSFTVRPGVWMAAESLGPWSLAVCFVTPAFTQIRLADRAQVDLWVDKYGPDVARLIHG